MSCFGFPSCTNRGNLCRGHSGIADFWEGFRWAIPRHAWLHVTPPPSTNQPAPTPPHQLGKQLPNREGAVEQRHHRLLCCCEEHQSEQHKSWLCWIWNSCTASNCSILAPSQSTSLYLSYVESSVRKTTARYFYRLYCSTAHDDSDLEPPLLHRSRIRGLTPGTHRRRRPELEPGAQMKTPNTPAETLYH